MKKTSVLVLLSGLFDRSRSRTVTALAWMPALYARCDDEAVKKEFHGELQRDRPGAAEQDARRDHHHRELRPQLKERGTTSP